jgi:hypothetical protein
MWRTDSNRLTRTVSLVGGRGVASRNAASTSRGTWDLGGPRLRPCRRPPPRYQRSSLADGDSVTTTTVVSKDEGTVTLKGQIVAFGYELAILLRVAGNALMVHVRKPIEIGPDE